MIFPMLMLEFQEILPKVNRTLEYVDIPLWEIFEIEAPEEKE